MVSEENRHMRGYLTMELIGTLWVTAGMFASFEKKTAMAVLFLFIGLSYFFRAIIKYFGDKEKTNAKIPDRLDPGSYAGANRVREYSGPSRNHIG